MEASMSHTINDLPTEVLASAFWYLDITTLGKISSVSKIWYQVAESDQIWKTRFEERFGLNQKTKFRRGWKIFYREVLTLPVHQRTYGTFAQHKLCMHTFTSTEEHCNPDMFWDEICHYGLGLSSLLKFVHVPCSNFSSNFTTRIEYLKDPRCEGFQETLHRNAVLIGQENVGKRTLFRNMGAVTRNASDVIESYRSYFLIEDFAVRVDIQPTTEAALHDMTPPNIAILCFNIADRKSLNHLREVWTKHKEGCLRDCLILLIGTHLEITLEEKPSVQPVPYKEAYNFLQEMKGIAYRECALKEIGEVHEGLATVCRASASKELNLATPEVRLKKAKQINKEYQTAEEKRLKAQRREYEFQERRFRANYRNSKCSVQ
eukprot:TRINITY_DN8091_c0_g1_i1.p1 TRINITY_DN8091_c0_g1~~TRINITY_DN8091_c0_g1_i1.p1  ORF type:complete len:376 (-),score=61.25 TRINITY_DN8091_c0_g1_i1:189-1316(-)